MLSQQKELNELKYSRTLIIDGLNTFIRAFAATNIISDNGHHIGGIIGFLHSMGAAINVYKPTNVIIVFDGDGGSLRRRQLYPDYKKGRRNRGIMNGQLYTDVDSERRELQKQLEHLLDYLRILPVQLITVDNIEADDTVAYLIKSVLNAPENNICIMSSDKDYLQLIDERVSVWSPTKKKMYNEALVLDEYKVTPQNFAIYKSLLGDTSDNIPGIYGIGKKTIENKLPILAEHGTKITPETLIIYVDEIEKKGKTFQNLIESKDNFFLNYKLVQLDDVDISAFSKGSIQYQLSKSMNKLNTMEFVKLVIQDGINGIFKDPITWLHKHFLKINQFINE